MPGCRRALPWLGSQLLYRRSQGDCPEPMRTSQRNLHHQLLRSGVLIATPECPCFGTVVSHQTDQEFIAACCARAASGHTAAAPPSSVMNSRRFVCRESSILRGDGGSVMTVSPSRPEARRRFGSQTASELGAPVASSIPEQLPGREPASARKGYEDALVLRNRRVEGSFGRHGVARGAMLFGAE